MKTVNPRLKAPSERFVKLTVNGIDLVTFHSSPHNLDELAVGFLFTEGLVNNINKIKSLAVEDGLVEIAADLDKELSDVLNEGRHRTSGCGKGMSFLGLDSLSNLRKNVSSAVFEADILFDLMETMRERAELYKQHGGVHCSALALDSKIIVQREDIGRHNTIDKIIGRVLLDNLPAENAFILTTGRISFEMIAKAAKIGVPLVGSHTAATDLAVEIAEELNIDIAGYIRAGKMVVYTSGEHLEDSKSQLKFKSIQGVDVSNDI
jgi:FdhD protein